MADLSSLSNDQLLQLHSQLGGGGAAAAQQPSAAAPDLSKLSNDDLLRLHSQLGGVARSPISIGPAQADPNAGIRPPDATPQQYEADYAAAQARKAVPIAAQLNPEVDPDVVSGNASLGKGALRGARDVVDGGAQLLARGLEAGAHGIDALTGLTPWGTNLAAPAQAARENVEAINRNADTDYQQNWRDPALKDAPDPGRFAGNTALTTALLASPLGKALLPARPGLIGGAITGGTGGVLGNLLQPVDTEQNPDYWEAKADQGASGAAGGAFLGTLGAGLGRAISPKMSVDPQLQALRDQGVAPTIGQTLGGTANTIEQKLSSIPVLGDAINGARRRAVEQFNRGAINQVLEPIGEKLADATPIGRPAIDEMISKAAGKFGEAVDKIQTVTRDAPFNAAVGKLDQLTRFLPKDKAAQFAEVKQALIDETFNPNTGVMTGRTAQDVYSRLGNLARDYMRSGDPDQRTLGKAYAELQDQVGELIRRSNPGTAPLLDAARKAYAMMFRVEAGAKASGANNEGVFTPGQLLRGVRAEDSSYHGRDFLRGDALMQDYAQAGQNVLGNTIPNSGTTDRLLGFGLASSVPTYILHEPLSAAGIAAGTGLAALPYTGLGQRAAAGLLSSRPEGAGLLAQAVRQGSPYVAGGFLPGLLNGDRR